MRSCHPQPDKYPVTYPKLISRKLDGIRGAKRGGKSTTKSGKGVPSNINRSIIERLIPEGFDFEMIAGNPADEDVYSRTFSAVMTIDSTVQVDFYVFDLHDIPSLYKSKRLDLIKFVLADPHTAAKLKAHNVNIIVVEQEWVHSDADVDRVYAKYLEEGYEGAILCDPLGFYKSGKCTPKEQIQLKLKPEDDYEVLITGAYEAMHNSNEAFTNEVGETERSTAKDGLTGKGMLGGFIGTIVATGVSTKISAGKMKHDERTSRWEAFTHDAGALVGRYCKARAMNYGTMANGALRHGRWVGWRDPVDMEPAGERT